MYIYIILYHKVPNLRAPYWLSFCKGLVHSTFWKLEPFKVLELWYFSFKCSKSFVTFENSDILWVCALTKTMEREREREMEWIWNTYLWKGRNIIFYVNVTSYPEIGWREKDLELKSTKRNNLVIFLRSSQAFSYLKKKNSYGNHFWSCIVNVWQVG